VDIEGRWAAEKDAATLSSIFEEAAESRWGRGEKKKKERTQNEE